MDPEVGDPEFYQEVIAPLVEKYNAYADRIQPDMSMEEIHEVFAEAYPFMMNVKFYVQELRFDYLNRKRTGLLEKKDREEKTLFE